jgi:cytochrome c551/c552
VNLRNGWLVLLGTSLVIAGCGGGGGSGGSASSTSTPAPPASQYDTGPRASEAPTNETLAAKGAELFKSKTCSTCHAFGIRVTGPDLQDVAAQRSAEWIQHQIQHPDIMTKEDPISKDLYQKYVIQMPNLHITDDEARALIEYIKFRYTHPSR